MFRSNFGSAITRRLTGVLAATAVLACVGCNGTGGGNTEAVVGNASINVPLVPQTERPERVEFRMRIELEDAQGRRLARIPIQYDFPASEITLLAGQGGSERVALQALQNASITSELSAADAAIVSVDRQARSSLMPLYGESAELALNSLRYQVARQQFGAADDLKLNVQSFYAGGRLVIGIWAEMYTAEGDWAGFHPAYTSWISVPLAEVGQVRLDEVVINVPALSNEIREVLRERNGDGTGTTVDLEEIIPPSQRNREDHNDG